MAVALRKSDQPFGFSSFARCEYVKRNSKLIFNFGDFNKLKPDGNQTCSE